MAESTLKLRRMVLSNFGPFVGDHELPLPESGLHMILGENLDTDESSGAGKSSFAEALAYAFDYSSFSATDLQSWSWLTEEPMGVTVDFLCPAGEVEYARSKKSQLQLAGKEPVTSAKAVKEELQRLVGVRPEILKALTYRAQGQPGMFLAMTDQEKKSFLTELLGLQVYETEAERIVKVISSLEEAEKVKKALAEQAQAAVPPAPARPELEPIDHFDAELVRLKAAVVAADSHLKQLRAADEAALQAQSAREAEVDAKFRPYLENLEVAVEMARSSPIIRPDIADPEPPSELPGLRQKLEQLRGAIGKKRLEYSNSLVVMRRAIQDNYRAIAQLEGTAHQAAAAHSEKNRLVAELSKLKEQVCPTCERSWLDDVSALIAKKERAIKLCEMNIETANTAWGQAEELHKTVEEQEARLASAGAADPVPAKIIEAEKILADSIQNLEAEHKAAVRSVVEARVTAVRIQKAEQAQKLAQVNADYSKAETAYLEAKHAAQEMTPEHVTIRNDLGAAKELVNKTLSEMRLTSERRTSAIGRNDERSKSYQRTLDERLRFETKARTVSMEHRTVLAELDRERDYLGVIRSFLGVIFDETLNRVAYLTNERLAKVPNVQNLTLRFVSERETKTTKNLRQEIRPIVERDGHEIPLKRTSGGQYTAVELAVDLSLADVIAERTGVLPGWLILDEAFNGLPTKSKAACLELLKNAATSRLILVVDHATEFKELFDTTITVRSRDGKSTFVI